MEQYQENNIINQAQSQEDEMLSIKEIVNLCLARWYWFAISVVLCLAGAVFFVLRTPPVYTRTAEVQIKSDKNGNTSADLSQFTDLGLFSTSASVYNEVLAFSSNMNMVESVKRLHLDLNYTTDGTFHDETLYGKSLPVSVELLDVEENSSVKFDLKLSKNGGYRISDFIDGEDKLDDKPVSGVFADTLQTPLGRMVVTPTVHFIEKDYPSIHVRKTSIASAANKYGNALSVSLSDKQAQVIKLSISDISIERADDLLNTLISVYNENWVADKNQMAVSTSAFINERLSVIESELAGVDSDISSFKSENLIPDVQAASSLYMSQSNEINAEVTNLNNQLYMTRYIREYLSNSSNTNKLLPVNSGISNSNIESQISEYNRSLIQRNNLVESSSESNPLVIDLDRALEGMRQAIITSVDNQILALNNQISSLSARGRQATARIAASPTQAKYLLSVERQQTVKEALYLFLLQKREENELSQAFTAYNTRMIDPPHGSSIPTSPRTNMVLLMALVLGLAIPFGIIYVLEVMNGKVSAKSDLSRLTMPFAGEIPLASGKDTTARRIKKTLAKIRSLDKEPVAFVVKPGNRNVVNEAFRVLRTNVEFMLRGDDEKVLALTSFNPGSGKSFITANLSSVLSIKGKKVLAVDCDFRHGSLSHYAGCPEKGFADYLSGYETDIRRLIKHVEEYEGMEILPVGSIPPNPTELISDPKFQKTIEELKKDYDYVFLDCPPVDIVADAQIINQYVDRTLFVIRAGLCDKTLLPDLQGFYRDSRFHKLTLILNGIELSKTSIGGYRRGYYSYCYGSYYSNDGKQS